MLRIGAETVRNVFQRGIMRPVREHDAFVLFPFGRSRPFAFRTPEPHRVVVTARHGGPPAAFRVLRVCLANCPPRSRRDWSASFDHVLIERTAGAAESGPCLTDAARGGRSGEPLVLSAAMLRTERVRQQSSRPLDPVDSLKPPRQKGCGTKSGPTDPIVKTRLVPTAGRDRHAAGLRLAGLARDKRLPLGPPAEGSIDVRAGRSETGSILRGQAVGVAKVPPPAACRADRSSARVSSRFPMSPWIRRSVGGSLLRTACASMSFRVATDRSPPSLSSASSPTADDGT